MSKEGERVAAGVVILAMLLWSWGWFSAAAGGPAGTTIVVTIEGLWCMLPDGTQVRCDELELPPKSRVTLHADGGSSGVVEALIARLVAEGHTVTVAEERQNDA